MKKKFNAPPVPVRSYILPALLFIVLTGCGVDYRFKSAEKSKENGEFTEAVRKYENIIKKYPESPRAPEAVYSVARIYHQNVGNIPAAKNNYRRVINEYSATEWAKNSAAAMLELADYFPLVKKASWVEVDSDTSGRYMTAKNEIVGSSGEVLEMTRKLYTRGNFVSGFRKYYMRTKDGFYETDKSGKIISTILLLPVEVDREWASGNVRYTVVSKNEEITVAAGKFENCVKIKKQLSGAPSWTCEYFAPEVGKILTTQSSGSSEKRITELKEFNIPSE